MNPVPAVQQQMPGGVPGNVPGGLPGGMPGGAPGGAPDIADIKGLIVPDPGLPWLWIVLGVVVAAVLVAVLVWFLRRRKRSAKNVGGTDKLRELQTLRRSPGVVPREVYARLSEMVREQLAEKYLMSAAVMNRAEIMGAAEQRAMPVGARNALKDFMEQAEAVLYAGFAPDKDAMSQDLDRVELFLRETMDAGQGELFEYEDGAEAAESQEKSS